jgi:5'-3' exonuclease
MDKNLFKILDGINKDENNTPKHERILLIDGLNLFFRNFAVLNYINQDGVHIGGLGGFLRSLGFLINQTKPTSVYIVFDGEGSSMNRKTLLPEYKSNRNNNKVVNWKTFNDVEEENNAKIDQISRLILYLRCLPVKIISLPKTEADDVIAYLSKILSKNPKNKTFIISNDQDYFQLITDNITVYKPTDKEYYTKEILYKKYNILPENFILYKTLLGDASDKIQGIKGLGKKGILKKFPELSEKILSLEDIFKICEKKYQEHIVYSRIIFEKNKILDNYRLMNLHNPFLDDNDKIFLNECVNSPNNSLNVKDFIVLYNQDGLNNVIKNVNFWIKDNFLTLNSF